MMPSFLAGPELELDDEVVHRLVAGGGGGGEGVDFEAVVLLFG